MQQDETDSESPKTDTKPNVAIVRKAMPDYFKNIPGQTTPAPVTAPRASGHLGHWGREPCECLPSPDVPEPARTDWLEARAVLYQSPNASAVLARRCLQGFLRDRGASDLNLGVSEQLFVFLKQNPEHRKEWHGPLTAVVQLGGMGAHPGIRQSDQKHINVQRFEARYALDALLAFFEALLPVAEDRIEADDAVL